MRGVGHVPPVGQHRVVGQHGGRLLDGQRLAGEGRLVDPQVPGAEKPQVGRHLVPGLQQDDVSGHQVLGGDHQAFSLAQNGGLGGDRPGEGGDGTGGLGLLDEADEGVDENHQKDDAGIHPFRNEAGDQARRDQNVDEGLMELEKKQHPPAALLADGDPVGSEALPTVLDLEPVEAALGRGVEQVEDVFRLGMVPVAVEQEFHEASPPPAPETGPSSGPGPSAAPDGGRSWA